MDIFNLLIEPVWNRNIAIDWSRLWASILLIEPVWNRNICGGDGIEIPSLPFNRTSMESKHIDADASIQYLKTFNRTSMESKLRRLLMSRYVSVSF